ncbi:MAG: glycosyltransferase family 2 protein [Oleiphilaceae bacterium]|nr:glycosyltransferase family 2 protein [Oleiphilaceae bacterium]
MLTGLFWVSAAGLVYIYLGYPLLVRLLAMRPRPVAEQSGYRPRVSLLIAAYNEADDIAATLHNKIDQDYPPDRLEILVISDESDDGTDDIVASIAARAPCSIRLFRQSPRQGKTAGLNRLVTQANGEILLFSDANSLWASDAISHLVAPFADPSVGYASGKMVYTHRDGSLMGDGCSAYMKYENWLRRYETAIGSMVGVDGGIDAMRRSLYEPLRADQLPDFVQPLKVVEKGHRVVYQPRAILREAALEDAESEFSMRVRVSLRALWALKDMRHLLNPVRYGVFSLQLLSHKLLRYYAFIPLVALACLSLILAGQGGWYSAALWGQLGFYGLACLGHRRRARSHLPPLLGVPYYLVLLNAACYQAARAYWRGEKKVLWTPRRG